MKDDKVLLWSSVILALSMAFQVLVDLGRWLGDEPTPHYSAGMVWASAALAAVLVFLIHRKSEFRGRTVVAILMMTDVVVSSFFWSFDASFDPGVRTLIDLLWLPGIALLYFADEANELFNPRDNFRL